MNPDQYGYALHGMKDPYPHMRGEIGESAYWPFSILEEIPGVSTFRKIWKFFFFDDPIDQIQNMFLPDDTEEVALLRSLRYIRKYNLSDEAYRLKPYLKPVKLPSGIFHFLWEAWRSSMTRLTLWRILFFNGVATGWWLLFQYSVWALTVIADVVNLYTVLIIFFSLILTEFVSVVLTMYNSTNAAFSTAFASVVDLASSFGAMVFWATTRKPVFIAGVTVEEGRRNDHSHGKLGIFTPNPVAFNFFDANGYPVAYTMSPTDTVVHVQYILKALLYAMRDDFRDGVQYRRLPLFDLQCQLLQVQNGRGEDRLDILFSELRRALLATERANIIAPGGLNFNAINSYMDEISKNMASARASVRQAIPRTFVQLMDMSTFLFCFMLPVVLYDADDWWLQYAFNTILVSIIYGFILLAKQVRHQLYSKKVNPYAGEPLDVACDTAAYAIDSILESALSHLVLTDFDHIFYPSEGERLDNYPQFPLNRDGAVILADALPD